MKPTVRRLLAELHGGAGALFGVILFVVLFSGCWSLGVEALQVWARPPLPDRTGTALSIEEILEKARDRGVALDNVSLILPTSGQGGLRICEGRQPCRLTLDPISGHPLLDRPSLALLKDLHKTAFIGFPGRILISLFGIALFVLCVGGLLLLGRRWRAPWHWRRNRGGPGRREGPGRTAAVVFDLHGVIGSWIFPWLMLFALTGALSGLGALGTVMLSQVAYPEQPQQVFTDLLGPSPPPASGLPLEHHVDLDRLLKADARQFPGFTAQRLTINHGDDAAGTVEIGGIQRGLLSTSHFEAHVYRFADGALIAEKSATDHGPWTRTFIAVQPLHFADYSWLGRDWASWLRGVHLTAGLLACLLCASGLHLWGLRRHRAKTWSAVVLPRLVEGVCGGLVAAAAVLLLSVQAMPLRGAGDRGLAWVFWCVWGAGVLLSLCLPRRWSLFPLYLGLAGGACLLAVGLHVEAWLGAGAWPPLAVDMTLLSCGAVLFRFFLGVARKASSPHPIPGRIGDQNA
ncbi:PepSY-associated TM helix domain-containing protein [Rhodospirillum sp. A1_3_36]|uniref:PepSY-associated TM helix domain-containing protein n=1 Tax=Rhodospirillum sp. A1_3_36 TaxID=3391666 RepID=UPI0039A6572F